MRRAAARSQCANHLKQIALGLHNFADAYPDAPDVCEKARLLPAGTVLNASLLPDQRLSWFVEMLPFVEQESLYRQIDRTDRWDSAANQPAVQIGLDVFRCPDWVREYNPEAAHTTPYIGFAGLGPDAPDRPTADRTTGVFGYERQTSFAAVKDGASNTIMVLESAHGNGPWAQGGPSTVRGLDPGEKPYLGMGRPFGGTHFAENGVFARGASIGCNAAMVDGSVRFLTESIAPQVLEALATIAGGEPVGDNW